MHIYIYIYTHIHTYIDRYIHTYECESLKQLRFTLLKNLNIGFHGEEMIQFLSEEKLLLSIFCTEVFNSLGVERYDAMVAHRLCK